MSKPPLTPRLVAYLKTRPFKLVPHQGSERKVYELVTESKLKQKALAAGYRLAEIDEALRHMESKLVYIGTWYDSKERVVYWTFYDMTPDEIIARQEDNDWFDSLPG